MVLNFQVMDTLKIGKMLRYYEEHVGKVKSGVKEFLEVKNKIEEGVTQ